MTAKKQPARKTLRLGLGFSPDDQDLLERIQKKLEPTHGKLATMAVVRMALIKLDREGL
jgi:hypothetical protein